MIGSKADILSHVAQLAILDRVEAGRYLEEHYPNVVGRPDREAIAPPTAMRVFFRDGFIDRYSGDKLVNPGALRALSALLPNFEYHQHGNRSASHIAYWELRATVDHLNPIALGGTPEEKNYRTTSMLRNLAKRNATLEQIGWTDHPAGNWRDWDGLSQWLVDSVRHHPALLDIPLVQTWLTATRAALAEL